MRKKEEEEKLKKTFERRKEEIDGYYAQHCRLFPFNHPDVLTNPEKLKQLPDISKGETLTGASPSSLFDDRFKISEIPEDGKYSVYFQDGVLKAKTKLGELYIKEAKFMALSFWTLHLNFSGFHGEYSISHFFHDFRQKDGTFSDPIILEELDRITLANEYLKYYYQNLRQQES